PRHGFQSVLFWIRLLNRRTTGDALRQLPVSIRVVLDSAPQPAKRRRARHHEGRFSIRFLLDSAPQPESQTSARATTSVYSPCCIDFAPTPPRGPSSAPASGVFQFLLFWIRLLITAARASRTRPVACFNPCCSGFGSSTCGFQRAELFRSVSIRVVLDSAP